MPEWGGSGGNFPLKITVGAMSPHYFHVVVTVVVCFIIMYYVGCALIRLTRDFVLLYVVVRDCLITINLLQPLKFTVITW